MKPLAAIIASMLATCLLITELSAQHLIKDTLPCIRIEEQGIILGDKVAQFPGGIEEWDNYVNKNLRFPKKAKKKKREGMVLVWFSIDSLGNVKEAKALNDPGCGLGKEAVRIVMKSPKWIPAEVSGLKANYRQIQTVTFRRK
jgi:protein TonB